MSVVESVRVQWDRPASTCGKYGRSETWWTYDVKEFDSPPARNPQATCTNVYLLNHQHNPEALTNVYTRGLVAKWVGEPPGPKEEERMATIHKVIELQAYCTCGRPLEQWIPSNHAVLDYVTFRPCPCQKPQSKPEEPEAERHGDGRRAERST